MVQTSYDINPEEFRVLTDSTQSTPQIQQVVNILKACAVKKTTTRVSFEKKS
jgi:hypothetical protein